MNIVDSSCWLEYFAGSKVGEKVSAIIEKVDDLLVPSITIYEVFKKLILELDEDRALFAAAHMKQGRVIDLDSDLAIYAAQVSKEYRLPMADSIIYAIGKKNNAQLWTQDKHFEMLDNVKYFSKEQNTI
jgi:predicted nucleic acid-binding protein